MGPIKRALISLIALALISTHLSAQVPTGKIFGTFADERCTPLPGVTVEATSPKLVGKGTAVSDENGVYRIFALTPGLYKLAFTLQGFKAVTREGIIVELEQSVKLNIAMDILRGGLYDINVAEYVNYQDLYGKDKVDRFEAGFNLGGFIIKDRLWFYGSLLPVYNQTKRQVKFDPSLIEGDYTQRDYFWNSQVKLTSQPFHFMRLGASFVSNFQNYKGDLPPRAGTGSPTDLWGDYGFCFPSWTAAAYADFTFGNNMLLSLRGGTFHNNTTGQLVQPKEPRYVHSGLGISIFPNVPAQYIKPRGWFNMTNLALYVTEKSKSSGPTSTAILPIISTSPASTPGRPDFNG